MNRMRAVCATAVLVVLVGCATAPQPAPLSDLERTWANAVVVLPPLGTGAPLRTTMDSGAMTTHLRRLPANSRLPIVLYVHGCTGVGALPLFEQLANAGFVVVAPDSFARRFRPLQCDPVTRTGGRNLFVYDFRLEEIAYALDGLWLKRWADWDRMYLVGASEGGVAAALYRGDEFKARVIAQWTCGGSPHVAGLAAPPGEPILALIARNDPWYAATGGRSDCGPLLVNRPDSRSLVVDVPGGHELLVEPSVAQVLVEFLARRAQPTQRPANQP